MSDTDSPSPFIKISKYRYQYRCIQMLVQVGWCLVLFQYREPLFNNILEWNGTPYVKLYFITSSKITTNGLPPTPPAFLRPSFPVAHLNVRLIKHVELGQGVRGNYELGKSTS